jgi:hypothetical protein
MTAATSGLRQTLGFALFSVVFLGWSIANGNLQHRRLRAMRDELGGAPAESRAGTASAVSRD